MDVFDEEITQHYRDEIMGEGTKVVELDNRTYFMRIKNRGIKIFNVEAKYGV
jgi:hypothetical protein